MLPRHNRSNNVGVCNMRQIETYRDVYHTKLQSELRKTKYDVGQVQRCNIIVTACKTITDMQRNGHTDSAYLIEEHQKLMQAIKGFEEVAARPPTIKVQPPTPRPQNEDSRKMPDQYHPVQTQPATAIQGSLKPPTQEKLPGMQEGDVLL